MRDADRGNQLSISDSEPEPCDEERRNIPRKVQQSIGDKLQMSNVLAVPGRKVFGNSSDDWCGS